MSYRTHQCGEFSAEAIGAEAKSRFTGRIPKVTIDVK